MKPEKVIPLLTPLLRVLGSSKGVVMLIFAVLAVVLASLGKISWEAAITISSIAGGIYSGGTAYEDRGKAIANAQLQGAMLTVTSSTTETVPRDGNVTNITNVTKAEPPAEKPIEK